MSEARGAGSRRRGCLRWLALAYGLALVASHPVRWARPDVAPDLAGKKVVEVAAVDGSRLLDRKVRLAYREWGPASAAAAAPVVLLLHGSPGSSRDFTRLAPPLAERFRLIAPDLPGFGASERDVPDYSVAAHARYARQLLDALGIERAHVLGYSMGGGVLLEMADQEPARVLSATMLSALGVEELELLGNHTINHALHKAQLAFFWALEEATPHFGLFDGWMLSRTYARNFSDTDQRRLRPILERFTAPMLVVHAEDDVLIPLAAARETARLVPQSELVTLPSGNHMMVFAGSAELVAPIEHFLGRVESGAAVGRAVADPARVEEAKKPFDPAGIPAAQGIALLALMFLLALATLVSEDLACIVAGILVAQGRLGFWPATIACLLGIVLGDVLLYAAGRFLGRPWLSRAPLKWFVKEAAIERSRAWFAKRGLAITFLSRFTPGTRLATYVAAGLLHAPFWRFTGWFLLASLAWTPLLVGVSSLLGARALGWFEAYEGWAIGGFIAIVLLIYLVVELAVPMFTWKGRRRLKGALGRKLRWEFWPPWMFYPPVLLSILWLAIKHRGLTVFTASNPAIPASGFIGESKRAILDGLGHPAVARYRAVSYRLSREDRVEEVRAFLAQIDGDLPVVLKPDAGQRGSEVVVVRTWEELSARVEGFRGDFLAQEYVAGAEFGVFYTRLPGEERGRIFSITEKRLPTVVGDGRRTLEELILADERAVCAAPSYFERFAGKLDEIPAEGEEVRLTDLGTHCRGAVFLDGWEHWSEDLEAEIDRISRGFEGFYFGRYDLRVPSPEHLRAGREIKVLELNGVTSEATHIYDPKNSLWTAYRVLYRQWKLAFEIGRRNRERGAPVEGAVSLLKRWLGFWNCPSGEGK